MAQISLESINELLRHEQNSHILDDKSYNMQVCVHKGM